MRMSNVFLSLALTSLLCAGLSMPASCFARPLMHSPLYCSRSYTVHKGHAHNGFSDTSIIVEIKSTGPTTNKLLSLSRISSAIITNIRYAYIALEWISLNWWSTFEFTSIYPFQRRRMWAHGLTVYVCVWCVSLDLLNLLYSPIYKSEDDSWWNMAYLSPNHGIFVVQIKSVARALASAVSFKRHIQRNNG